MVSMNSSNHQLLEKILKGIIIAGSFLVVLVPLVVVPASYFPYIIQKTLILRILIELIFGAYLALALFKPQYRPKKSLLLGAVLAFVAVMLLTTFTSQSVFRSWWGNWERSFGTFNYLHYFLWFIALISVFNKTKYWYWILNLSLATSVLISLYALNQRLGLFFTFEEGLKRVNGTIGNSSFLASYLLFHLFLALLFLIEKRGWRWKIYYLLIFALDLTILIFTGTRGALLALFFSVVVFIIAAFWQKIWRQKTIKFLLAGCFLLLILVGVLFFFKDSSLVKSNFWLKRITSFSLEDNTIQTRLRSWNWGLKGFRDNLLFGLGPENYQIAFNRYFQGDFYDYSPNEVWFDRAHNTLIDMASTMGIFGLLAYLTIFGVAGYYLYQRRRQGQLPPLIFIVLFLLFFSYFLQNIVVFDSLNSLIIFYLLLAYLHHLYHQDQNSAGENRELNYSGKTVSPLLSLPMISLFFLILFFAVHLKEIKANLYVYNAYVSGKMNKYDEALDFYDKTYQTAINKIDPAFLLSSSLSEMVGSNSKIVPLEKSVGDLRKAAVWMDQAIALDPQNMFLYYLQSKNYSLLAELTREVKDIEKGIAFAGKANELSPGNVRPLWVLAQFYLFGGQPERALNYLDKALAVNDHLADTYFYRSIVYANLGDKEKTLAQYDKMIDFNYSFFSVAQVNNILPRYEELGDLRRIIYLLDQLTALDPNEPNYWINLVQKLIDDKQYDRALAALKRAADAIPALSSRAYTIYQDVLKLKEGTHE